MRGEDPPADSVDWSSDDEDSEDAWQLTGR